MARPPRKGLTYFPMDVDYYDDEKIFALMDTYGPLGSAVYENVLAMVYRQGYYIEVSLDSLAAQITRRIGSRWVRSIGQVKEIILHCGRLDLFDDELLCSGVVTSRGIQRRYAQITIRRKHRDSEYWLLDGGDNDADMEIFAEETDDTDNRNGDYNSSGYTNKTKQNKTKPKESKVKKSIVNKTKQDVPSDDGSDELKNSAVRVFERAIRPLSAAEMLRLDNLCMLYGNARVIAAIMEMQNRGANNVGYVEAILRRSYNSPPGSASHSGDVSESSRSAELEELMEDGAYDVVE